MPYFILTWGPFVTMQIIKSYLHWAVLAPEGRVKVSEVKKPQHSGSLLKKKQVKLDQHQTLVFMVMLTIFQFDPYSQKGPRPLVLRYFKLPYALHRPFANCAPLRQPL